MKVTKPKPTALDKELSVLKFNANVAASKYKFHGAKTYGKMAEIFGVKIEDIELSKKFITLSDIEKFRQQQETTIRNKYGCKREDASSNGAGINNGENSGEPRSTRDNEEECNRATRTMETLNRYDRESNRIQTGILAEFILQQINQQSAPKLLIERTDKIYGQQQDTEGERGDVETTQGGDEHSQADVPTEDPSSRDTIELDYIGSDEGDPSSNGATGQRIINSIYQPRTKTQRVDLLPAHIADQVGCASKLFNNIWYENKLGQLLIAPAGSGKTFILSNVISNLLECGLIDRCKTISPWPIFYVTAASIVDQSEEVLKNEFGLDTVNDIQVVNIEMFRTKFGGLLVKRDLAVVNNEAMETFNWMYNMLPALIIWDESQMLAREQAIQTKIACAVADAVLRSGRLCYQIDASATPFSRVTEAKHFVVASGIEFTWKGKKQKVTNDNWRAFARWIASPFEPEMYSVEAVKQLIDYMEPYIVRIAAINPKYKAKNSTMALRFKTKEQEDYYYTALKRYEEEKAKLESNENLSAGQLRIALLATFTILRKAAEFCKCEQFAEWMDDMYRKGFAPLVVVAFKATITKIVRILIEEYGWTREDISLIWGGSTETLTKKKKVAKRISENKEMMERLMGELGVSLEDIGVRLEDMEQKTDEQLDFEKVHKLSSQSLDQRHEEKMRFQRQDSRGMLITFKAGGKGLSAHHESKYPNAKPRRTLLSPVYSEKEMLQGLGRAPRITSASDTLQCMAYFVGTIEVDVKERFILKAKCMKEVVRLPDSWMDIVSPGLDKIVSDISAEADLIDTDPSLLGDYIEEDTSI